MLGTLPFRSVAGNASHHGVYGTQAGSGGPHGHVRRHDHLGPHRGPRSRGLGPAQVCWDVRDAPGLPAAGDRRRCPGPNPTPPLPHPLPGPMLVTCSAAEVMIVEAAAAVALCLQKRLNADADAAGLPTFLYTANTRNVRFCTPPPPPPPRPPLSGQAADVEGWSVLQTRRMVTCCATSVRSPRAAPTPGHSTRSSTASAAPRADTTPPLSPAPRVSTPNSEIYRSAIPRFIATRNPRHLSTPTMDRCCGAFPFTQSLCWALRGWAASSSCQRHGTPWSRRYAPGVRSPPSAVGVRGAAADQRMSAPHGVHTRSGFRARDFTFLWGLVPCAANWIVWASRHSVVPFPSARCSVQP